VAARRRVFHEPMLALKAVALRNMLDIFVARAVFHEPMLALKVVALRSM
jgi:hypothetical protein